MLSRANPKKPNMNKGHFFQTADEDFFGGKGYSVFFFFLIRNKSQDVDDQGIKSVLGLRWGRRGPFQDYKKAQKSC